MMRSVSQQEFVSNASSFVQAARTDMVVIRDEGEVIAALVPWEEYEMVRQARARKAIDAMNALRDAIHSTNPSEEELLELERALDRKA